MAPLLAFLGMNDKTEALWAEAVLSPHLLCYVKNNFKAPQFILHRAIKSSGSSKMIRTVLAFTHAFQIYLSPPHFWGPDKSCCFFSSHPLSLLVISSLFCFLLTFPLLLHYHLIGYPLEMNSDFFWLNPVALHLWFNCPVLALTLMTGLNANNSSCYFICSSVVPLISSHLSHSSSFSHVV